MRSHVVGVLGSVLVPCALGACSGTAPRPEAAADAAPGFQLVGQSAGSVDAEPIAGALPHPRILFTPPRVEALRRGAAAGTPAWRRTKQRCDEAAGAPIKAGYEAWDWANALGSL